MNRYSIIKPKELYPVKKDLYIVSGYPFLYIKSHRTLIFGDIHLGQEEALIKSTYSTGISSSSTAILNYIDEIRDIIRIDKIIINGDIKHNVNSISPQEIEELKYFVQYLENQEIDLSLVRGNHDMMLDFLLTYINKESVNLTNSIKMGNTLIFHGDRKFELDGVSLLILGHEHPSFTFKGNNGEKIKLPAFVQLMIENGDTQTQCIILPATSKISLGRTFPVTQKEEFISPILNKQAIVSSTLIYPFDYELGLFELPKTGKWFTNS